MVELHVFLFGSPNIIYKETPILLSRRKALAVFIYLLMNQRSIRRTSLATFLWDELEPQQALARLRRILVDLNKTPLKHFIEANHQTISISNIDNIWVDIVEFTDYATQQNLESTSKAIDLYHTDFLAGFTLNDSLSFDNWQTLQTQVLHNHMISLLSGMADQLITLQKWSEATEIVSRWIMLDPIDEAAYRTLMHLYHYQGHRSKVVETYNNLVEVLQNELETIPHHKTQLIYENIVSETKERKTISQSKSTHLPNKPQLLIGRDKSVAYLTSRLVESGDNQQTIVYGLPGIGKTTLMAQLVYQPVIQQYFGEYIFWTSLGESPNLIQILLGWAQSLGLKFELDTPITIIQQAILQTIDQHEAFVVIDDVWEIEHALTLKLPSNRVKTVLTTRETGIATTLATNSHDLYRLPILDEQSALRLLDELAPSVVAQYPDESLVLVQDLEGLPLAIQVAGRLLKTEIAYGWGIKELLAEIQQGLQLLDKHAPVDRFDISTQTLPTIAVLLKKSTDRLDDESRMRFALLGVFASKPARFDEDAIEAVWQGNDSRSTLRKLVDRGLLESVGDGVFQMHALLAMHARSLFNK